MWIIFVGVLAGWLVVALAVGFGVVRAIQLRNTHTPVAPQRLAQSERVRALAA